MTPSIEELPESLPAGIHPALASALAAQGYSVIERRSPMGAADTPPFRGRLLSYRRATSICAASA